MRCFIKKFPNYLLNTTYDKMYQDECWEFTGRIKYQRDEDGTMVVTFEVIFNNDNQEMEEWFSSWWFDFDYSGDAVIVECSSNK